MNITDLNRMVKNGLLTTHTLGLMGNHGIGKTSYVHNTFRKIVAEKHNIPLEKVHVISRCVSIMDPADLIGNFQEFGGRTYNCPPSWIPVSREYDDEMEKLYAENGKHYSRLTNYDDIYILFLDECKRGNSIIQDAIMELLLEHRLFGVNLKENTYVVCADNDNTKVYNGTRRDPAQESRIKKVDFAPTNKEFLQDYSNRVDQGLIHRTIYSFLNKYPDYIVLPTKTIEELSIKGQKGPSPRDWTQLGECLKKFADNNDDITRGNRSFLVEVAASFVGFAYALKFADFCEYEDKNEIDLDEVLNKFTANLENRLKDTFEKNPKAAVPVVHSLLERVKKLTLSDVQSSNICAFLACCPSEAIASFLKGWQKESKDQFLSWCVTPKRYKLFNGSLLNKERKGTAISSYERWEATFMKKYGLSAAEMDRDDLVLAA